MSAANSSARLPASGSSDLPARRDDRVVGLPVRAGRGLRVAIMTDETGWHTRRLQRALRERGAEGRCIDLERCHVDTTAHVHGLVLPGFGAVLPDAVIVRGIAGGSFEQVTKRLSVLHMLRELGVVVYNDARAIERSVDKAMTSLLLHAAGVRTPATWVTESAAAAAARVAREAQAGHAVVLKPLFGSQGHGVVRAGRVDGRFVALPPLAGEGTPYGGLAYLQRFVSPMGDAHDGRAPTAAPGRLDNAGSGHDWRVLVIGGRARAAMRRVSRHWVHNVSQGARCEPQALDDATGTALARTAERAAMALAMDYAGIDLMPTPEGPTVLEVNGVAAWRGLQRVTAFDIARALVDDLIERRLPARAASGVA